MKRQGNVVRWDAARGFGFIRSPGTAAEVFFHVRDFRSSAPPREGLAVTYEEIHVGGKGPRAMAVQPATTGAAADAANMQTRPARRETARPARPHHPARADGPRTRRTRSSNPRAAFQGLALLLMIGWVALLAMGVWNRQLPVWVLGAAVAVNLVTFWMYAADKNAARNRAWRTPESHLHLLSLAGGWPGAWYAQQAMRHKSSKPSFRAVYWLTVLAHCGALAAWVSVLALPG